LTTHFGIAARAVKLQAHLSLLKDRRTVAALPAMPPSPLEEGRPRQSFSKPNRPPIVDPITTGCPPFADRCRPVPTLVNPLGITQGIV
jgi:hypothetical protein